jgi:hypothetical protein
MPKQKTPKTPEERSEILEKANSKARRGYNKNTKRKAKLEDLDIAIVKDQLVALKVIGGYSNTQCAMIIGISKGQCKEIVADPNFKSHIEAVKKNLPQAALNLGRAYLVEAVQAVVHVMRTEHDNALVLKAAAEIFDRFGIPKVSRSESKIDTTQPEAEIPNDVMTQLKQARPEVQAQIADLHEGFLEGVTQILEGGKENNGDSDEA